jgi:hypothetical protein
MLKLCQVIVEVQKIEILSFITEVYEKSQLGTKRSLFSRDDSG